MVNPHVQMIPSTVQDPLIEIFHPLRGQEEKNAVLSALLHHPGY
jgi:hypothetical protein